MITADQLQTLTSFTAPALSRALQLSGYKEDTFTSATFVGMTNAGQFCYKVTYPEHGELATGKVFLSYDPTNGTVTADY